VLANEDRLFGASYVQKLCKFLMDFRNQFNQVSSSAENAVVIRGIQALCMALKWNATGDISTNKSLNKALDQLRGLAPGEEKNAAFSAHVAQHGFDLHQSPHLIAAALMHAPAFLKSESDKVLDNYCCFFFGLEFKKVKVMAFKAARSFARSGGVANVQKIINNPNWKLPNSLREFLIQFIQKMHDDLNALALHEQLKAAAQAPPAAKPVVVVQQEYEAKVSDLTTQLDKAHSIINDYCPARERP
jgi:hypothetical protein